MRRRTLLLAGAGLVLGGGLLMYELRTPDAPVVVSSNGSGAATSAGARPSLDTVSTADHTPVAIQRMRAAQAPVPTLPAITNPMSNELPVPPLTGVHSTQVVDAAMIAQEEAHFEKVSGRKLTPSERKQFEAMHAKKPVDVVPGTSKMREHLVPPCTGPDAQQRYSQLAPGARENMRIRCAKQGVTFE